MVIRETETSMPLPCAPPGQVMEISTIIGGHGLCQKLTSMGIIPGSCIKVNEGHRSGPLIIDIKGSRIALGCGVAQKIMVKERKDG
ncbi:hypothetical protein DGWBC_1560 [Dehalogenimonas sp. WBC-2]|nr:hypothetical protein DGWBC_1560 [Dehalogenimonas sp. WBC-2]